MTGHLIRAFTVGVMATFIAIAQAWAASYYASPLGNDANPGTSQAEPWQTINKINASHFAGGDTLNLDAGNGPFSGCIVLTGANISATPTRRFTIQGYNSVTSTWQLNSDCGVDGSKIAAVLIDSVDGITVLGGKVDGNGSHTLYGFWLRSYLGGHNNITLDGTETVDFNTTSADVYSVHVLVDGFNSGFAAGSLTIENMVMHGLTPTSPDQNCITGYGDGQNIIAPLYTRIECYNMGGLPGGVSQGVNGNGIWANGTVRAEVSYSYVHDISANVSGCGASMGIGTANSGKAWVHDNEVARVRPTVWTSGNCDFAAFDADGLTTDSTFERNYSHDNAGPAWEVGGAPPRQPWNGNVSRYNISVNDGGMIGYAVGFNPPGGLAYYNNTIYIGLPAGGRHTTYCYSTGFNAAYAPGAIVANNLCVNETSVWGGRSGIISDEWQTNTNPNALELVSNNYQAYGGGGVLEGPWMVNGDNRYYWSLPTFQSATGNEVGSLTSPAGLWGAGTDPTCHGATLPCPSGYQLTLTSTMIGKGVDLSKPPYNLIPPSVDFYGRPVPNGVATGGWNIGADGSTGR